MADLFPETLNPTSSNDLASQERHIWEGPTLCKWGNPRVVVKLLPMWDADHGWRCGWLIHIDRSLDEWNPIAPNAWRRHSGYPWHRPDGMPQSDKAHLAMALAAFEARLVMQQMLAYTDPELHTEILVISLAMDAQRRTWQLN